MGFESFTVLLTPCDDFPLEKGSRAASAERLAEDIQQHWPSVRTDSVERDEIAQYVRPGDVYLFSETVAGLFQMLLKVRDGGITISLRFALCNPPSVEEPFCAMITWLMQRYHLQCRSLSYAPPPDAGEPFCEPEMVAKRLMPSMAENRRVWQLDAGTVEVAPLRPGEAISRFILPRCVAA